MNVLVERQRQKLSSVHKGERFEIVFQDKILR